MRQFCTLAGMKKIKTSPYHPQTDGMVERFNATLKRLLRKLVTNPQAKWDNCIPYVLWARRNTHKTTGLYPYQLLFGKEMKIHLGQSMRCQKGKGDESGVSEYVHTLKVNMELVREMAYERKKEEKMKPKK